MNIAEEIRIYRMSIFLHEYQNVDYFGTGN